MNEQKVDARVRLIERFEEESVWGYDEGGESYRTWVSNDAEDAIRAEERVNVERLTAAARIVVEVAPAYTGAAPPEWVPPHNTSLAQAIAALAAVINPPPTEESA